MIKMDVYGARRLAAQIVYQAAVDYWDVCEAPCRSLKWGASNLCRHYGYDRKQVAKLIERMRLERKQELEAFFNSEFFHMLTRGELITRVFIDSIKRMRHKGERLPNRDCQQTLGVRGCEV